MFGRESRHEQRSALFRVSLAIAQAAGTIVQALVNPILQIAIVLIYFDLRVRREGLDLFQLAQRDVEQMADTRRQSFEEPDMRTRAGQIDMTQPLAAHFRLGNFNAANSEWWVGLYGNGS